MPKLPLTPKATQIMGVVAAAASLIMLILLATMWVRIETQARSIESLVAGFDEANKRLAEAGKPTVAPPPSPPDPPVVGPAPRGIVDSICQDSGRWRVIYTDGTTNEDAGQCRGPAGAAPSPDQIKIAFAAYCRDNGNCRGPAGKNGINGKNGQNVTIAQAVEAIATYCDARGQCRGEKGDPGEQGPSPSADQILAGLTVFCADGACRGERGEQGEQGKQGPGPTEDQIAAEIADYCTDDRCRGPKGEPGKDSTVPGPQGRGIAEDGTKCVDGRWQITYTDGTTDEDAGPCTPQPGPTVTVTPPPTEEEKDR